MNTKTTLYAGMSAICFIMATIILIFAKPFAVQDIYDQKVATGTGVMSDNNEETVQETKDVVVHNYDTEYGDKNVLKEDEKLCQDFTKVAFNIGYRNIVNSREGYTDSILKLFDNGKVEHGSYSFTPSQFADFLANMVDENLLQIESSFLAETTFEKNDIIYINGILNMTIHAGNDLSQISGFFGTDFKLNEATDIPVSFMISRSTGKIIGFSPAYTIAQQ